MYQLDKLLESNPDVQSINLDYENLEDLTLCMKYLKKFPRLISLSLHGNKLKMLPLCHDLKQLMHLDLTGNKLKIDGFLLDSLYSLPRLQNLQIDGTELELERILQNLPNLQMLNNKKVIRKQNNTDLIERRRKQLQMLEIARDQIKELNKEIMSQFQVKNDDLSQLDFVYKESKEEMREFLENVSHEQTKEGVYYNSKKKMLDVIVEKVIEIMEANGFQSCANALNKINFKQKQFFDAIFKVILQIGYAQNYLEKQFINETNTQLKNIKLRKERLYLKQIMRLKKLVDDLKYQISKLEEENHRLITVLKNHSVNDFQTQIRPASTIFVRVNNSEPSFQPYFQSSLGQQSIIRPQRVEQKPRRAQKSVSPIRKSMTPSKSQPTFRKHNGSIQNKSRQNQEGTVLSLEQTLKLVEQIVKEKQNYNKKCQSKKQCFETAEQFLSVFFTKKHRLKALAISTSLSFIKSLQLYSKDNTQIEVFLKILKNKLEESFYEDHKEFTNTINYKLPIHFRKSMKNGTKFKVNSVFMHYFPGQNIEDYNVTYKEDIQKIQELQVLKTQLHRIHIETHENQLAEFLNLYSKFDAKQNGFLDLVSAQKLVHQFFRAKIQDGTVPQDILQKVDSKFESINKQKLVFSEIVEIVDKI